MPALEIIRKALDPSVSTPPHLLVRAGSRQRTLSNPALFESVTVRRMWLTGPTTPNQMPTVGQHSRSLKSLSIGCLSDELERIAYVPAQKSFEFPIPLYEGKSSSLAWQTFRHLDALDWGFSLALDGTAVMRKTDFDSIHSPETLSKSAARLFRRFTSREYKDESSFSLLTRTQRLDMIRASIAYIRDRASESPDDDRHYRLGGARGLQPQLWITPSPSPSLGYDVATPPEVAHDIVAEALRVHGNGHEIHFGDPAIGRGRFFVEAKAQCGDELISAEGVEIDGRLADAADTLWRNSGLAVAREDFLSLGLQPTRTLIIANPPYLRSQDLSPVAAEEWRATITESLGITPSARSDLYVYFLLRAHDWMADGATAAWLIPSEFKFTEYGEPLRRYLTGSVNLLRVHVYSPDSSMFDDARVSSTVLIFRKAAPRLDRDIRFSVGGSLSAPLNSTQVPLTELRQLTRWPLGVPNVCPVPSAEKTIALGQLFKTRRGIATGANEFFVLDADACERLEVPEKFLQPVLPRARYLDGPIIYARPDGSPVLSAPHWLLNVDVKLEAVAGEAPALYEYLASVWRAVGHRRIVSSRPLFAKQETRPHTPFLFGYMSRGTRSLPFYLNRSNATYLNNYIGLYPRFDLRAAEAMGIDDVQILAMLRELGHDQVLSGGRLYVDGLRKAEPRELQTFTLPDRLGIASTLLEFVHKEA